MIGEAKISERMHDRHNDESPPPDPDDRAATHTWPSTHFDLLKARPMAIADDPGPIHVQEITERKAEAVAQTVAQP